MSTYEASYSTDRQRRQHPSFLRQTFSALALVGAIGAGAYGVVAAKDHFKEGCYGEVKPGIEVPELPGQTRNVSLFGGVILRAMNKLCDDGNRPAGTSFAHTKNGNVVTMTAHAEQPVPTDVSVTATLRPDETLTYDSVTAFSLKHAAAPKVPKFAFSAQQEAVVNYPNGRLTEDQITCRWNTARQLTFVEKNYSVSGEGTSWQMGFDETYVASKEINGIMAAIAQP